MIYLDNAATTRPKPPSVAEAVAAAMNDYGNSGRGTHPEALEAARSIYGVRQALAALFGCSRADRVAFTPNSTMALNIAISGLLGAGDHVISTDLEHNSVLRPLYRLRAQGGAVDFVPADRQGRIDYEDFERLLRPNTKAVVCTHGSNLTGDLMDIQRVGNFCQKHRLLFILDASQTAGVFPIDMERQHISVVCFTGHKSLMGPQGTGGLCVGAGVEIRPFAVGGTGVQSYSETQPEAYPTRLEAGTLNSHGIAGLGASLAFLKRTGWDAVRMHESVLARRFYETVRTIPGVKVYGNFAVQLRAPIVSLNIADLDSSEVADELAERFEIATRPGAHHHRRHLRRRQHLRQSIPLRGEAADPPIPAAAQHLLLLPHLRRHGVHQMQLLPCVDGAAQHLHRQHVLLRDAQQPGCSPVQGRLLLLRGQFQALQLQHGGTSFTKCSKKNPFLKAYIKLSGYDNRQRNGTVLNIIAQFPAMGNIPKGGFSYVQRVS